MSLIPLVIVCCMARFGTISFPMNSRINRIFDRLKKSDEDATDGENQQKNVDNPFNSTANITNPNLTSSTTSTSTTHEGQDRTMMDNNNLQIFKEIWETRKVLVILVIAVPVLIFLFFLIMLSHIQQKPSPTYQPLINGSCYF